MAEMITVVGAGPGDPGFISETVKRAIDEAEVLVGGKRLVDRLATSGQTIIYLDRDLGEVIGNLQQLSLEKKITVIASGDPGFFGILSLLRRHFSPEQLEVLPGISSVQLAFAKIKEPWQDARVVSLHGRGWSQLQGAIQENKLAILTDAEHYPAAIAGYLLNNGVKDVEAYLCSNLSYESEVVLKLSLEEMVANESRDPAVVVILRV